MWHVIITDSDHPGKETMFYTNYFDRTIDGYVYSHTDSEYYHVYTQTDGDYVETLRITERD